MSKFSQVQAMCKDCEWTGSVYKTEDFHSYAKSKKLTCPMCHSTRIIVHAVGQLPPEIVPNYRYKQ